MNKIVYYSKKAILQDIDQINSYPTLMMNISDVILDQGCIQCYLCKNVSINFILCTGGLM